MRENPVEQLEIKAFMEQLSSGAPVPGGGGTSALVGALGAALGQMVCNLTTGKKKYAAVEEEIQMFRNKLSSLQRELVGLANDDEKVFEPLAKAYSMPTASQEERVRKDQIMEENLLSASLVPLAMMEKTVDVLVILQELEEKGSTMAVSDVGVGVQMGRAAILGAVMNVLINTRSMKNREKAEALNNQAYVIMNQGTELADQVYEKIRRKLICSC